MRYQKKLNTFYQFGRRIAKLSVCKRNQVGVIIFPFDCSAVYSLGYNGPPRGISHNTCTGDVGDCGCIHAETNALLKLKENLPCVMFTTVSPCYACTSLIINKGCIQLVVFDELYRNDCCYMLTQRNIRVIKSNENV